MSSLQPLSEEYKCLSASIDEVSRVVVGQNEMIEQIFIGLLCSGHVLIEGLPGLAKTLTISSIAKALNLKFKRVQFTPDLLPTDITGTTIYNASTHSFNIRKGPVFTHVLLADEINRAPAKVQSALLEAMGEKQVTIGDQTHSLEQPFLVLATQNPIEHEGTYPLPEAQMDRFLFKILITYPSRDEEEEIFKRMSAEKIYEIKPQLSREAVLNLQSLVRSVNIEDRLAKYMIDIIMATRTPKNYGLLELTQWIQVGASPRATINLPLACRARAFLQGRGFATADDVKAMAYPILRHRLILTYEAQAEGITSDQIIETILNRIQLP